MKSYGKIGGSQVKVLSVRMDAEKYRFFRDGYCAWRRQSRDSIIRSSVLDLVEQYPLEAQAGHKLDRRGRETFPSATQNLRINLDEDLHRQFVSVCAGVYRVTPSQMVRHWIDQLYEQEGANPRVLQAMEEARK